MEALVVVGIVALVLCTVAVPVAIVVGLIWLVRKQAAARPARTGSGSAGSEWTVRAGDLRCRVFRESYIGLVTHANLDGCVDRCVDRAEAWLEEQGGAVAVASADLCQSRTCAQLVLWYRKRRGGRGPVARARVFHERFVGLLTPANIGAALERSVTRAAGWLEERAGEVRVRATSCSQTAATAHTVLWWEPVAVEAQGAPTVRPRKPARIRW